MVEGSRIVRGYHITNGPIEAGGRRGSAEIADYIMVYRELKLGVVEAKKLLTIFTEGVAQAKRSSREPCILTEAGQI